MVTAPPDLTVSTGMMSREIMPLWTVSDVDSRAIGLAAKEAAIGPNNQAGRRQISQLHTHG